MGPLSQSLSTPSAGFAAASPAAPAVQAPMLARLLDALGHGALLLSPRGRVFHATAAARQALRPGGVLATAGGILRAGAETDQAALDAALQRAEAGRRSLVFAGPAGPGRLALLVMPLGDDAPGLVAALLSRTAVCDGPTLCLFARAHGLTGAEEQVLGLLCEGLSTPEAARRLGVAVSTVRTHVRSLCVRTGTSGGRALVHRLASLPAATAVRPGLLH